MILSVPTVDGSVEIAPARLHSHSTMMLSNDFDNPNLNILASVLS